MSEEYVKHHLSATIDGDTLGWLSGRFKSTHAGASYCLDTFPIIYRTLLRDIRGAFTRAELDMLVDKWASIRLHGIMSKLAGTCLLTMVIASKSANQAVWGHILDVVTSLNESHLIALEIWLNDTDRDFDDLL